jgi:hypothetical protein
VEFLKRNLHELLECLKGRFYLFARIAIFRKEQGYILGKRYKGILAIICLANETAKVTPS